MSLPIDWVPFVSTTRRWRYLKEKGYERDQLDGLSAAMRTIRLDTYTAPLPPDFPSRTALLAADYLGLEDLRGAGVSELRYYGFSVAEAHAIINRLDDDTEISAMSTFQAGPNIGQEYEEDSITLRASSALTATANGDSYELGDKGTMRLASDVTAVSGTSPTVHVQIQTRALASDSWRTIGAFDIQSAAGVQYQTFPGCDRFVRGQYTLGGSATPTVTFSVTGTAV